MRSRQLGFDSESCAVVLPAHSAAYADAADGRGVGSAASMEIYFEDIPTREFDNHAPHRNGSYREISRTRREPISAVGTSSVYATVTWESRYHATVLASPSSQLTIGSYPNKRRALEISACESLTSPGRGGA